MDVLGLWGALHPLGYRFPQLMRLTNSQSKEEGRKKHFTGLLSLSVHPKERLLGWYLEGGWRRSDISLASGIQLR